jgi:hypothetical protein
LTLDVKENILLSPLSDLDKGDNKKKLLFFTFGYKEKYYYLPYQTWIREVIKKSSCFLPLDVKKNILLFPLSDMAKGDKFLIFLFF